MVKEQLKINGKTIEEDLQEGRALIDEAKNYLLLKGEPVELDKWLTIKRYCEHFGINDTQVVTNWIRRGIIPPENVKEVEELNGLRLIKAIPYNT